MFLFNGENNKLHASRNSGESRKLIQEGEGKFYGAMSLRRYQEMGVGCCAQGSGAQEQMVGGGGWAWGSSLRTISSFFSRKGSG